jgi:hypothetical protein
MKITRYGSLIFTEKTIQLDGWAVLPELDDPKDATPEQMLLETVIPFAQKKMNEAIMANLKRISKEKKAANPTTVTGSN